MSKHGKLYYKTCREQAGLTQEQAAERLGIEVGTLSRYENGHTAVDQKMVKDMILLYGVGELAGWHMEYTNQELLPYVQVSSKIRTDGDVMFKMELVKDAIGDMREVLKDIFRGGASTAEDVEQLNVSAESLENLAAKLLAVSIHLKERDAGPKEVR